MGDGRELPGGPRELLRPSDWRAHMWGAWESPEHITLLEARTLAMGVRRLAHTVYGRNCRCLFLVDNLAVALAFERCRSQDFRLLNQIRRVSTLCLARNLRPSCRWIPGEVNVADGPSRAVPRAMISSAVVSRPMCAATSDNGSCGRRRSRQPRSLKWPSRPRGVAGPWWPRPR